jgi:hypothetical protein
MIGRICSFIGSFRERTSPSRLQRGDELNWGRGPRPSRSAACALGGKVDCFRIAVIRADNDQKRRLGIALVRDRVSLNGPVPILLRRNSRAQLLLFGLWSGTGIGI